MDFVVICAVAFGASLLTFFTGFGLGTLLLPAFAAFFLPEVAVALTGVVHLLNSLFKLLLVGRHTDLRVAVRFGIPAVFAAFGGALLLLWLASQEPMWSYEVAGHSYQVLPVSVVIALLMVVFAGLELWPRFKRVSIPRRYLSLGGLLTGFFGGLSGHQGALRSAFLIRSGLEKKAFIATGAVIAALVDVTRLLVYSERFLGGRATGNGALLGAAVLAAFVGAVTGSRLLGRISLRSIEIGVAILLILVAAGMGSGVL